MRALFLFLYGVAAYVAFQAVLLYFIGFSGSLRVLKSVDVGASTPWVEAFGTDLLLLTLFGVQHGGMARRDFKRWWTRRAMPEARFRTPLPYRWVRHPLYAGFLLTFWSVPVMTAGRLLFAIGFSAYIFIGIAYEERDLLQQFGERYRRYRGQVGMVIPNLRSPGLTASVDSDPTDACPRSTRS